MASVLAAAILALSCLAVCAEAFKVPTANQAIFERGAEEKFFVGTVGKPWMSGTFGCVRTEGWQMHEGLDIRMPATRPARRTNRSCDGDG